MPNVPLSRLRPTVRDVEIENRLRPILIASQRFTALDVEVQEGIVFLDGRTNEQTETDDRKEGPRQLACGPKASLPWSTGSKRRRRSAGV